MKISIENIFKSNGCIAKKLPNYEEREEQIKMAKEIQNAIENEKHLMVEAGTGIGKSLAYLVPFIFWCKKKKKKVVVSTYTKTLQEQLTKKDLPFLKDCLGIDFEFALCVGSENYLCRRRLNQVWQYGLFENQNEVKEFERIAKWADITQTGLKMELDFEPKETVWMKVCREPDLCISKKCQYRIRNECFYSRAKAIEAKVDILVVNHHLFFTNIVSKGRILPAYDAIVFDEAHNIEEVATQYLGIEISNSSIKYLLDRIYNVSTKKGLLTRIPNLSKEEFERVVYLLNNVRMQAELFFQDIIDKFGNQPISKRIRTNNVFQDVLKIPLTNLAHEIKSFITKINDYEISEEIKAYGNRLIELRNSITSFLEQDLPDYVYWIEILPKERHTRIELHTAPVDVSSILKEEVFEKTKPIILTSATLTVNRSFKFIKERIGLEDSVELLLDSPFDYQNQALLYTEENLPDPSHELNEFKEKVIEKIKEIIEITKGRTFILFTSYELLQKANEILKQEFANMRIIAQGEAPKWQMIEEFKRGEIDILLGTNTFWQGIDVPGKALECVIIPKLPFLVPDDPLIEAKIEYIMNQQKDPFIHYTLPMAIIMLKQGFGRLIRTKTDYGVVAILDPRIKTRYYGRWFIESLPKCKIVNDVNEVKQFYEVIT